jgi:hypothetical protein
MLYESEFLVSLGATLALEVPVVYLFVRFLCNKKLQSLRVILVAILASVLTLPYLWFILPPFVDARLYLWYGEAFVILVEACLFLWLLGVRVWFALLLALCANLFSFFVGPYLISWLV